MLFLFAILRAKVSSLVQKKQLGKSSLGHSLFYELRTLTRHPTVWKERLWWPWSNRTFSNRLVSLKTSEILFPGVLRSARKEPYPHKDTCLWQRQKSWQGPQQNKLPETSPSLDLSLVRWHVETGNKKQFLPLFVTWLALTDAQYTTVKRKIQRKKKEEMKNKFKRLNLPLDLVSWSNIFSSLSAVCEYSLPSLLLIGATRTCFATTKTTTSHSFKKKTQQDGRGKKTANLVWQAWQ